jgi:hypothetical protein
VVVQATQDVQCAGTSSKQKPCPHGNRNQLCKINRDQVFVSKRRRTRKSSFFPALNLHRWRVSISCIAAGRGCCWSIDCASPPRLVCLLPRSFTVIRPICPTQCQVTPNYKMNPRRVLLLFSVLGRLFPQM